MIYSDLIFAVFFSAGIFFVFISGEKKKNFSKDFRFAEKLNEKIKEYINDKYILMQKVLQKKQLQRELGDALSYIKNITILGNGKSVSAVSLLGDLSDFSDKLKPAFLRMARYLQMNDKEQASKVLGNAVGTSIAKDIGVFLAGWEDIKPEDILDNIDAYQSMIRNENITEQKSRDELISDVIYFPVILNCMAVLLNFVYIAYYVQQQELFQFFLQ